MKKLNIAILLFCISFGMIAQTAEEALRYSRLNYATGTAKATSMAGSLGALGGNFTSLSINPAGIGVYRSAEITITPSVMHAKSTTNYLNNKRDDEALNFNFGSFGMVFALPLIDEGAGFKYIQLGLGVNRTNNFKRDVLMKGFNNNSSITSQWVDDVNNAGIQFDDKGNPILSLDPYNTNLAWETYVLDINTDDIDNPYIFSDMQGGGVEQTVRMLTSGSMNEFVLSGGFNFDNKLFVGATFGIPYFSYKENYIITEEDTENINPYFGSMRYSTTLYTSGTGVNFKIGAIYKPIQWLRLGLAVHTPTRFSMSDEYHAELTSYIDLDGNSNHIRRHDYCDAYDYSYKLRTPLKLIGSVGFVIGQHGSVNFDYTFQDYSKAKFKDKDYSLDGANKDIQANYKAGHNFSLGTEWVFGVVRLRAGGAYELSPYKYEEINSGGERMIIGAGIGFIFGQFYTDLGYAYVKESKDFYPYDRYYVKASENKYITNQFQLTVGLRF